MSKRTRGAVPYARRVRVALVSRTAYVRPAAVPAFDRRSSPGRVVGVWMICIPEFVRVRVRVRVRRHPYARLPLMVPLCFNRIGALSAAAP